MIITRTIKPARPFRSSTFRDEINRAMRTIANDARADFERTTATWMHKPEFVTKVQTGAATGGVKIIITPEPEKPYLFVDQGTRIRYATMSKDFKAKTEPDVVQAFPGKGRKLFVSKKRPRPGIKARNFTKHIAKTYKSEVRREVKDALTRAARRSGYAK